MKLKVGDQVWVRGGFGAEPRRLVRVEHIEATEPGEKYGEAVDSVSWDQSFVIDTDDGHWARSHQCEPFSQLRLVNGG